MGNNQQTRHYPIYNIQQQISLPSILYWTVCYLNAFFRTLRTKYEPLILNACGADHSVCTKAGLEKKGGFQMGSEEIYGLVF